MRLGVVFFRLLEVLVDSGQNSGQWTRGSGQGMLEASLPSIIKIGSLTLLCGVIRNKKILIMEDSEGIILPCPLPTVHYIIIISNQSRFCIVNFVPKICNFVPKLFLTPCICWAILPFHA